jgi:hypothetical protein
MREFSQRPEGGVEREGVPFDYADDVLREPQHERFRIHFIQMRSIFPLTLRFSKGASSESDRAYAI